MLRRAGSAVFVLFAVVSCEALVNGDLPAYTCDGASASACPQGQYCKGAGCSACEKNDPCDGFDNDCNGVVDDGPLSDKDGDKYSWCGVTGQPDCDDTDATIHPGAMEICNGKDDDCNGAIDDNVCMPPSKCSPKLGKCITNACDPTDPMSCPMPSKCDPGTLQCVMPASKMLGDTCTADSECPTGMFCVGGLVLANRLGPGAICSQTCCTSKDCPSGAVCYGPGTGGSYCVKASAINRPSGGSTAAGASAGAASDCRSGLLANGRCADTCCFASDCASGTSCMTSMLDGHLANNCTAPYATTGGDQDSDCTTSMPSPQCKAGQCVDYGGGYHGCSMPCCNSAPCGHISILPTVCYNEPTGNDYAQVCSGTAYQVGSKPVGAQCGQSSECRSLRCSAGYCSDVCCTDRDCGGSLVCRPTAFGGKALRCVMP
jgi:hypothetical protein